MHLNSTDPEQGEQPDRDSVFIPTFPGQDLDYSKISGKSWLESQYINFLANRKKEIKKQPLNLCLPYCKRNLLFIVIILVPNFKVKISG